MKRHSNSPDLAALGEALARNVWRGAPPPDGAADRLAAIARAQAAHLAGQGIDQLAAGRVAFLPAEGLIDAA